MSAEQRVADLKAEIARIQAKRAASSDKDIQEALQFKEDALSGQLKTAEKEFEAERAAVAVAEPTEPTMTESEIEHQVRLARAHLAGDRKPAARDILFKLEAAAPSNVDVLELKADMLISAKDYTNAYPILKRARELAPKNVTIEKKLAEVAFFKGSMGSVDDQLRMGLSDSPFLVDGDIKASATAATVCSVFLPGLGHLVVGMTKKGIVYLSIWVITVIIFVVVFQSEASAAKAAHRSLNVSMWLVGLGFILAMDYMVALFECAALGKGGGGKRSPVDRPKPPVDLPFE